MCGVVVCVMRDGTCPAAAEFGVVIAAGAYTTCRTLSPVAGPIVFFLTRVPCMPYRHATVVSIVTISLNRNHCNARLVT